MLLKSEGAVDGGDLVVGEVVAALAADALVEARVEARVEYGAPADVTLPSSSFGATGAVAVAVADVFAAVCFRFLERRFRHFFLTFFPCFGDM